MLSKWICFGELKEFGYLCLDKWIQEGHIKEYADLKDLFSFDEHPFELFNLGWCEADFCPFFNVFLEYLPNDTCNIRSFCCTFILESLRKTAIQKITVELIGQIRRYFFSKECLHFKVFRKCQRIKLEFQITAGQFCCQFAAEQI